MHIADGVLSTPAMVSTNALAAAAVGLSLKRLDYDRVPRVGVLSACFFLASFLHVRVGVSSVHLLLNGFVGLLLGSAALPALAVALFLQAYLFGFGGVTALGANLLGMGIPALLVGMGFSRGCRCASSRGAAFAWGAAAGGTSVALTCAWFVLLLHWSDPVAYAVTVKALIVAHLPVLVAESAAVGAAVAFLRTVRPDLLEWPVQPTGSTLPGPTAG